MKDPFAKPDALRLKPLEVEGWPAPIDLVQGKLTLGRSADNDVTLPGESFPSVSARHARIEERGRELWVLDLGSRNGTLVNGERVTERALRAGDIVRLGAVGPKFMVASRRALDQTVFVDPKAVGLVPEVSKQDVEELVARNTRRTHRRTLTLAGVLCAVIALLIADLAHIARHDEAQRAQLASDLVSVGESLEHRLTEVWTHIERAQPAEVHAAAQVEHDSAAVSELRREIDAARAAIDSTRERLAGLEVTEAGAQGERRLDRVSDVRRAVVLIESRLVLRHRDSGELLYEEREGFGVRPNFERRGEVFALESTGSGFCVAADGSIITNVHVVSMPEDNQVLLATSMLPIDPVLELHAVFSGETRRHPLEVIRRASDGIDLALVRIAPFEGMPYVADFDVAAAPPEPGSDIFLLGFPLGHFALQEGERVIASTFRGILSRYVGGQLQVDAGVHPGNSGGPIVDAHGRIIGVVFSVQSLPDQTAVYTIGYGIPIAEVARVWSPDQD